MPRTPTATRPNPITTMDDAGRARALTARCDRFLHWHGQRTPGDLLAELPDEVEPDRYGDGGVVAELEAEVAELLGKPAAVFMPSGTMAQQIALRIHAEDVGSATALMHPTAHLLLHEDEGPQRLHGLTLRPVGSQVALLSLADLEAVAEPTGSLLLELPQREIGGRLPSWEALVAQTTWARERGMAVHMDGARLWEAAAGYDRPHAEVAALFDSVYVSFYKGLGAIAGACLVGEDDLVERAREWRHRHGGMLFALWPYAASALAGLRARLDRMPAYLAHARAIAAALNEVDGVEVVPDAPQVSMFHVAMRTTAADFRVQAHRLALEEGIAVWSQSWPSELPSWQRVELTVGDATLAFTPEEVADVIARLASPVGASGPAEQPIEVLAEDGSVADVVPRARMRAEGLRHRSTYVVVLTSDDEVVVHRRAEWKDLAGGHWDLAFGGICDVGEPWEAAARRELAEEAGLQGVPLEYLGEVEWSAASPTDPASLVGRVWVARFDGELHPTDGEVTALDRVPLAELDAWLASHEVVEDTRELIPPLLRNLLDG